LQPELHFKPFLIHPQRLLPERQPPTVQPQLYGKTVLAL
jgi:hypothetical protein